MTEENYNYRTSQTLLRNQFPGNGKLKIPVIPKFEPRLDDFNDLLLIGFDKTHVEDQNHLDRMVHFFFTITALSESGKIRTATLSDCLDTVRCFHRILACTWKWRQSCRSTTHFGIAGAEHTGRQKECV